MVALKNDFYNKFAKAGIAGNESLQRELMMAAIAKTIIHDRSEVMELINIVGIPIDSNASNKEIAAVIAKHAGNNEKFQDGLAYLVSKNNGILPKTSSADAASGAAQGAAGGLAAGPLGAIIGSLAGALGGIFQNKAESTKAKSIEDSNRMALVAELIKQDGASATNAIWYVLGGLALVGFVFVIIKSTKK